LIVESVLDGQRDVQQVAALLLQLLDRSGVDGPGVDGPGVDGSGIDGSGIDGSGIDGSGVDGSAVDGLVVDVNGTWNSKLNYPGPLLHDPIYRSLKALGPEVDDFLSEIFHRKDDSLSSPPNEYLALFLLLTKVTSTRLDFDTRRFCLPSGQVSGGILQVLHYPPLAAGHMPKEFFDHPNNVVINSLKAKGWRNSLALLQRAGFVDVIPVTTAIPYGKTSTARGIPDDTLGELGPLIHETCLQFTEQHIRRKVEEVQGIVIAACGTIAQNTVKRSLSQGLTKRQTLTCDIYYSQGSIKVIVFNWKHYCYPYLPFLSFENRRLQEAARIHDQGNDFLLRLVGGILNPVNRSSQERSIERRRHWLTNNWHAFQTRSIPRQRCIIGTPRLEDSLCSGRTQSNCTGWWRRKSRWVSRSDGKISLKG
jgi:hypothetical protein